MTTIPAIPPGLEVVLVQVAGVPAPAGSKSGFPNRKTGGVTIRDSSKRAKPWQAAVAAAGHDAHTGTLLDGPLAVLIDFLLPRPKGHFGAGRNASTVRPSAPHAPAVKPDLTKYVRAIEDALTGVVWRDDAQVVELHARKLYSETAECFIWIVSLGDRPFL